MTRNTIVALSAAAAISLAGYLAGSAEALRPAFLRAAPSAVGVVDMATVFDRVDDAADWDLRIRELEAAGIGLFERIESADWTAIEGLPLLQLAGLLRRLGVAMRS